KYLVKNSLLKRAQVRMAPSASNLCLAFPHQWSASSWRTYPPNRTLCSS
ncbi:hypothetical protein A2U01_0093269, partial [Trifolium medium]|nr:hypothetical protein [Trifolium medium]